MMFECGSPVDERWGNSLVSDMTNAMHDWLVILKGFAPYEYVCKIWISEPKRFGIIRTQQTVGFNT